MNSELDRIFEQGLSDLTRTPKTSLSDEQIASAAKESKSGAVLWLRMHVKEILACAILLSVGIAGTLLVSHFTGNQESTLEPAETVAAVVCDTTMDTDVPTAEPAASTVETFRTTSPQPLSPSVQPQHANSPMAAPNVQPPTSYITNSSSEILHPTSQASQPEPVIVKKTIVQRDTVFINETVIIKDTTYVP